MLSLPLSSQSPSSGSNQRIVATLARLTLGCGSLAALATLAPSAHADAKAECVAAYEDAQTLRSKSELRAAHEKLLVCAAESCPKVVLDQCAGWLDEVEKATPTVNFAITDEQGKDLADVTVSFDGTVLKSGLDGKAVSVDPGRHTFKFEAQGRKPIEQMVVVREGEKNRQIDATWKGAAAPPPDKPIVPVAPESGGKLSPAFWVLGGVGVVGLGLFATFGGLGMSQKSKDAGPGGCAPKCTDAEVGSIHTKFVVADVSLALGLASLAGAGVFGVLALTSKNPPPKAPPATSFSITGGPLVGGGYAGVTGRF